MDCSIVVVSKALVNKKVFYLCLFPLKCLEIIEKSELVVYSSPVSVDCFKSVSYHPPITIFLSFQEYPIPMPVPFI